jgi:hypothetical protein
MTTGKRLRSTTEFGKRQPTPLPPAPGPKRSNHVALLVMGTLAVGGGAYALMPGAGCQPSRPGAAAPGMPQANAGCTRGGSSSSGGYGRSTRFNFFGGTGSLSPSSETSGGVTRGGFGSFARAFGFGGG